MGKILNIPLCVINVRSVFQENNKYYPQVFLRECFYEYEYDRESYDSSKQNKHITYLDSNNLYVRAMSQYSIH